MDAAKVIDTMNKTWSSLLDQYYDHISNCIVSEMTINNDINKEETLAHIMSLKSKIMNTPLCKDPSKGKEPSKNKEPSKGKELTTKPQIPALLTSLDRKALQRLAKCYNIPAKSKSITLIEELANIRDTPGPSKHEEHEEQETTPPPSPQSNICPGAPVKAINKNLIYDFEEEEYETEEDES